MGNSNTIPEDRVRIFSRDGTPLAEFRADVARSWVIGGEWRAQFEYPTRKTDVIDNDVIHYGNWVFVQNTQLPGWVGVIDFPREWSTRKVTVSAYGADRVFGWRIGPLEEVVTGAPGKIFANLINRVNAAEATVLRVGSAWQGGANTQVTLNPSPLSKYLKELWETSGEDYTWVPSVGTDGKLTVNGKWVQFLGAETGAMLHEGKGGGNIEAAGRIMVEDGPIVNRVLTYGDGETWRSKPNVAVSSALSVGAFGLREGAQEYQGVTSTSVLQVNGEQYLSEFKAPARSFALNALNVGDTFKHIQLGNILNIQLQSLGFRGGGGTLGYVSRVRIVGMSYDPETKNKIKLVAREVV